MHFRDRLFAALAKEIEEAQAETATHSGSQLMQLENYHYNVGYWNALKNILQRMVDIAKKEETGEGV